MQARNYKHYNLLAWWSVSKIWQLDKDYWEWITENNACNIVAFLDPEVVWILIQSNVSDEHTVSILSAEDGDSMFLRNFGIYLQAYTELQLKIKTPKQFSYNFFNIKCDRAVYSWDDSRVR
jgi:hypothetical protein